jgi:hypothetical protein
MRNTNADLNAQILRCRDATKGRDDHNNKTEHRPIYVLRLRPVHGDGIRALRRLLKYGGRYLGLRCLGVTEEKSNQLMS